MLTAQVETYLALRRTLGFRLDRVARRLHAFVRFKAPDALIASLLDRE